MKTLELSAAHGDDVSRTGEPRSELRRNFFTSGVAHDWNFLPAHVLGKKNRHAKNVDFFATSSDALGKTVFRPCLRPAIPLDPSARPPKLIERLRAEVEARAGRTLDGQGNWPRSSIDPSTARRQFKRHYGMTFQAYHSARGGWALL